MPRKKPLPFGVLLAVFLAACQAPLKTEEQTPQDPELVDTADLLLGELIEEKARLLDFQYVLNTTWVAACESMLRPQYGVLAGSADAMDDPWLREAALRNGLTRDSLTVLHVVPGSAFERAGVRVGDSLVEVDRQRPTTNSELHRVRLANLDLSLTRITVARGGERLEFVTPAVPGCPISFLLNRTEQIFPTSLGPLVYVPRGLMAYASDDDLLGIALAHGMAHSLYVRSRRVSLEDEMRADSLGLQIAARAGFDTRQAIRYWEDVATIYPHLIFPRDRHKRLDEDWAEEFWSGTLLGGHHDISSRMQRIRIEAEHLAR